MIDTIIEQQDEKLISRGTGVFRKHYAIVCIGVFLALLVSAPVIVFPFFAGSLYQGINIPHFGTDAHLYLTRVKDSFEGHRLGAPVLREGKDNQDSYFMYNERVLATPFRLLGLSTSNVVTLYNHLTFVGVFFLALLLYALVFQLSKSRMLSLVVTIFVIAGYHIVYRQFFYVDFNIYGRAMFPLMSSLTFFVFLNFLTAWLLTKVKRYHLFATVTFGLLFYVYFFAWTFALALLCSLILVYALKRDSVTVKGLLYLVGSGILIGSYNLLQMFNTLHTSVGTQISYFHWSYHTHAPMFSNLGGALLLLLAFFTYKRRKDHSLPLLFAVLFAIFVALNQQVITGQVVQIGHYYWYFFVPLFIISALYMCWVLLEGRVWRNALFAGIALAVCLHGIIGQYRSYFVTLPEKMYEQTYRPFVEVLKADKRSGVILMGQDYLSYLFTIYTDHDLFWAPLATQTLVPFDRFKDTFFVYMYLNKESRYDFQGYTERFMKDSKGVSVYKDLYMNIEGYTSGFDFYRYQAVMNDESIIGKHRDALIASLASEYATLIKDAHQGIDGLLSRYGVKYIILDTNRYPEWDITFIQGLTEIMKSGGVSLHQFPDEKKTLNTTLP